MKIKFLADGERDNHKYEAAYCKISDAYQLRSITTASDAHYVNNPDAVMRHVIRSMTTKIVDNFFADRGTMRVEVNLIPSRHMYELCSELYIMSHVDIRAYTREIVMRTLETGDASIMR